MLDFSDDFNPVEMVSSSDQSKKSNKPLMEKRRRARINRSLAELKSILIETSRKSVAGHAKWEKADILELTVQHLHSLMNHQKANQSDPLSVGQFIAGFSECLKQIQKFSQLDPSLKSGLQSHLLSYLKSFSSDTTQSFGTKPQMSPTTTCSSSEDSNGDSTPPRDSPDELIITAKLEPKRRKNGWKYRSDRLSDVISPYGNALIPKSNISESPILASRLAGTTLPQCRSFPSDKSNVWRPW